MPAAHCPICFNHIPIDTDKPGIVIFPCGHGYCKECSDRLFRDARPKCPNCRVTLHRREGHPVYLELVDSSVVLAASVAEGLDQINTDTPLISIKKANLKLGKVIEGGSPGEGAISALLKAIEDFQDRIIPLFTKVEHQKKEMDSLRKDLQKSNRDRDHYQNKSKKAEGLQVEVDRLELSLRESEQTTQEAIRLAEVAKDELGKVHEASAGWRGRAAELDQENKRFKDQLERHVINARSQKEKNKDLAKKNMALKQQLAERERESPSDTTHEYDGDFSTHEQSRIHSSFTISASSSRSPRHSYNEENENPIRLELEGMHPPGFHSEWQLHGTSTGVLKKRYPNGPRRHPGSIPFPIDLDRKGRPTRAVQLGPSIVHLR